MKIHIKTTLRTKLHLNVQCKNRNKIRVRFLILLVFIVIILKCWYHPTVRIFRLRWAKAFLLVSAHHITTTLKCKSAVGLRWDVWYFQTFLSALFLFEIRASAWFEVRIVFLWVFSEVYSVETDRLIQIGNFKPTGVKSDDVWMTVLAYYADLFDWLV